MTIDEMTSRSARDFRTPLAFRFVFFQRPQRASDDSKKSITSIDAQRAGLILSAVGALLLALGAWIKARGIREHSISVGHCTIGAYWKITFLLGWPLLVMGFILQYLGSA